MQCLQRSVSTTVKLYSPQTRRFAVKQEILFSDVSNCVASLKKVVLDIQSAAQGDTRHQMAHPTVRYIAFQVIVPKSC